MQADWQPPGTGPRVYGLRLRVPLSLGHVFLLDEIDSPVVHGGPLLLGDVAVASFICSMPHAKARRQLGHRTTGFAMWAWGKWMAKRDHESESRDFAEWFFDQAKAPERWIKGDARECASPWWINRAATAMATFGMSFGDAMDMPLKRLSQLCTAHAESRGEVELVSGKQIEFRELVRRTEEAKATNARN